jgi:trimeric autotransporter adhesin
MRRLLIIAIAATCSLFFVQCSNPKEKETQIELLSKEEAENEDGIKEAMEMDVEMTLDPKLGYVPAFRLVKAYNDILMERRAGRYASRITALNWVERGPNTNTLGPSNGNTRGPGPGIPAVSGRMRAIHVDLNDATNKTVWAASVSGGLWKTTDITASPANWVLVNDFLGNLAITSICQSPANKNIMYFATGERNNNIDAVRGGGVWQSTDGGITWSLLNNTINFWNVSKIVCDAAGNVYVGANGNNQGLQRSTNAGGSWTNITPANIGNSNRITDIKLSSTGRLHVTLSGTSEAGSYFTDNPSTVTTATWTSPTTAIPGLTANCEIAVAGNTLYALPEGAGAQTPQIYKSIDGGINWAPTPTSPPSPSSEPTINPGQGWYNLAIGVDPNNPDICVAGGLNFYRTIDGGNTWTQITRWVGTATNYVHADHHGVFWAPNYVLLATDGGIFYSNNNGLSYTDRNVGIRTLQFYSCALHPTLNYYLGGTQDNGSHSLTSSGPITGSIEVHGGDGGFTHIDEDEPQFQFSATTRSNYRRSTNNGVNWSSVAFSGSIGQFINPTEYDDINNRMYCSGNAGTYVRWDNPQSGSSFATISLPSTFSGSTIRSFKVSPSTPNRVFMGTGGGFVLRVDNADQTTPAYTHINNGAGMPGGVISCVNTGTTDNHLIATYTAYGVASVWVTSNGGTNWTNVEGNLPDIPVRWAMFYPENNSKAIIATEMGIFETDNLNGAATVWVQNGTFPSVKTNMLQYRISDGTILAATHGRGFFTTQAPASAPFVRFGSSYNYSRINNETPTTTDGCRSYRDYTLNMLIDAAPAGDANVTLNIASGTAIEGLDYDITTNGNFAAPSKQLTFPNGVDVDRPVTIRVYDDAIAESAESFTLTYTIGGGTNAVPSTTSTSYTFHIGDNDITPVAGTTAIETVLNSNRTIDVRTNNTHLVYSAANRIMISISGANAPLGCVSTNLKEAESVWLPLFSGTRSQKVFDIATTSNFGTNYSISLYFTASEMGGKTPSSAVITATTAPDGNSLTLANTFIYATTVTPFGSDFIFTATVPSNMSARYFLTEGTNITTSIFDLNRNRDAFARLLVNPVKENIQLVVQNDSRKKIAASLFSSNGMLLRRWDAGTVNGNVNLGLDNLFVLPGVYMLRLDAGNQTQTFKIVKQ